MYRILANSKADCKKLKNYSTSKNGNEFNSFFPKYFRLHIFRKHIFNLWHTEAASFHFKSCSFLLGPIKRAKN